MIHYIENTYKTKTFLTDKKDSIIHSPDYHIQVKYMKIAIDMKSARINNPTLLILYNKIKTESNLAISSKIFKKRRNQEKITFCHKYNANLTNTIENSEASVAWCGFIWFPLIYTELHDNYGESIRRFIPTQWRPWWIGILQYNFPKVFGNIEIYKTTAAFKDITNDIDQWKTDISTDLLSRLAPSSNTYLLPDVKYPWGCL